MRAATVKRWLRDEVTFSTAGGVNEFGEPTGATETVVPAKVAHAHRRSASPEGEEFTSTTQVVTLHPATVGDTVTIDGAARRVRAIKSMCGLAGGVTLYEVLL